LSPIIVSHVRTQTRSAAHAIPDLRWRRNGRPVPGRMLLAAILTVLIPGLGHLLVGRRRRGWALIGVSIAAALLAVALVPREPFAALAMFSQPRNLGALLLADVALFGFRAFAVIDVVRGGWGNGSLWPRSAGALVLLTLLLAVVAAPHVVVGYYDIVTWRFLEDVFDDDSPPQGLVAPTEVQLTREVRLKDGVEAAAPPVVAGSETYGATDDPNHS
jgi:hypothetical protein